MDRIGSAEIAAAGLKPRPDRAGWICGTRHGFAVGRPRHASSARPGGQVFRPGGRYQRISPDLPFWIAMNPVVFLRRRVANLPLTRKFVLLCAIITVGVVLLSVSAARLQYLDLVDARKQSV